MKIGASYKCSVLRLSLPEGYFLPSFYPPVCPWLQESLPWGMQGGAAASQARGSEPQWLVLWALGKGLDDIGSVPYVGGCLGDTDGWWACLCWQRRT